MKIRERKITSPRISHMPIINTVYPMAMTRGRRNVA